MATESERGTDLPPATSPGLTARLAEVVQAKRHFFAARALVAAGLICLLLAAGIICADIGFAFGPLGRWLAFGLVLTALGLILASRLVLPWRRYHEHQAVRDLEAACDGVGQLLRTSAEVAREADAKGFSPALSQALLQQAEATLVQAPMARVVPWPTVRRWAWGLAAVALAFALTALLWPDFRRGAVRLALPAAPITFTHVEVAVTPACFERGQTVTLSARLSGRPVERVELERRVPGEAWAATAISAAADGVWSAEFPGQTRSFDVRLRAGDARVRRHIRFIDPPAVLSATVQVDYPAYMRLPPASLPLKDLRVPEGATLRLAFTLNHPLVRAAVRLPEAPAAALDPAAAPLAWEWTAVPGTHAFALAGEDAEGLVLKPFSWEVRAQPDHRPQVTLVTPDEDITLTPIGETPVAVRVQDDFGIAQAELILTIDGKERRLLGRDTPDAPRQLRFTHDLRLEDLKLTPGTAVRLHARARDLHPDRAGWSVSAVRVITIRPLQILRRPTAPPPPAAGQDPNQLKEDLATLEQAIERQKQAVQETLQRREEQPDSREPMAETAAAEQELAKVVDDLAERADAQTPQAQAAAKPEAKTPAQTPTPAAAPLLAEAEQRLQAAAEALTKPEMTEALRREDQALSAMMQARDLMQQQLAAQQAATETAPTPQTAQPQPPPQETLDALAQRAEALARTEAALQAQAQTPTPAAAQQQAEAVQQAAELAKDIRDHARTTPLAAQRMDEARERMDEALAELRDQDRPAAAAPLDQAEAQLQELAMHLRGLDPARAAETLERAADLAEAASQQLIEPAPQPPAAPTPAAQPPTPAAADPEATPEQVARHTETVDDWLQRLATEPAKGLEATRNHLRELRQELRTETLADQVRQAEQDRQQDRPEQAQQAEQNAAERLQKLADGLEQEHQRLVRSRLEQLAAAESKAKALQAELNRDQQPPKDAPRELRELATQLQDLRDAPLYRAAREIRAQIPSPQGTAVPERVRNETLPGAVARLRTLIDEVVQRELLVDRDARIPAQYSGLVESYFKALSDEQK